MLAFFSIKNSIGQHQVTMISGIPEIFLPIPVRYFNVPVLQYLLRPSKDHHNKKNKYINLYKKPPRHIAQLHQYIYQIYVVLNIFSAREFVTNCLVTIMLIDALAASPQCVVYSNLKKTCFNIEIMGHVLNRIHRFLYYIYLTSRHYKQLFIFNKIHGTFLCNQYIHCTNIYILQRKLFNLSYYILTELKH
eukprot:TRINITY_DN26827_c0_g3_i1.p1 TRINITY_DN26827_c0_g3~~TRINITY_DN26827_c0_g3_i1.p1  ORF type:complete len:200 (+),score=-25.77 TRINITY_DN26827_c0_g3_i1:30-602(+)